MLALKDVYSGELQEESFPSIYLPPFFFDEIICDAIPSSAFLSSAVLPCWEHSSDVSALSRCL